MGLDVFKLSNFAMAMTYTVRANLDTCELGPDTGSGLAPYVFPNAKHAELHLNQSECSAH